MKKTSTQIMVATIILAIIACAIAIVGFLSLTSVKEIISEGMTNSISISQIVLIVLAAISLVGAISFGLVVTKKIKDKYHWYESVLDSIPFPISVTDIDMNWTFINKPVEDMLGIKRIEVLGKQCENWNAKICKTANCGIARLRSGELQTQFEQLGMDFQVDTAYIKDRKGRNVGHIEVVQDISAKVKGAIYSKKEVEKLAYNLKNLAAGHLSLEFKVDAGDKYTESEKKNFEEINSVFKDAVDTIKGYIDELTYFLSRLAMGDFTDEVVSEYRGDFVALKDSLNKIYENMNGVFSEIMTAADQVASGTMQVSDGSQEISQGATEQASSIEELTASLTQIAAQTRQNAVNANTANELSLNAKNDAAAGNDQMKDMQKAMLEINESSSSISKIIKVIDDIAFQTNILALNAAVEAARAGVHGKGFAVVAEEVRNLAARSASAARETTELIEGSIRKVEAGTKIADGTANALSNIVSGVEKAVELVGGIAVASNEQASAIAQVNKGIEQITQVVQTNSATAEEAAAASEELSSQADLLKGMIGQFKLKGTSQEGVTKSLGSAESETALRLNAAKRSKNQGNIVLDENEFGKY